MQLFNHQKLIKTDIYDAWDALYKFVLAVSPTGSGKTVIFSDVLKDHDAPAAAIAHRQELVSQISLALARDEVQHKIVGPKNVIRLCVNNHLDELGKSYYNPNAHVGVAGVDTLIRRKNDLDRWTKSVTKWIIDEAHHVLLINKWGKALEMFPNAIGLGVTATPDRADGKGLGRHAAGIFDTMVQGPNMRDLINMGFLTDYRVFAPQTDDLDLTNVAVGAGGDFVHEQLVNAVRRSHIIGDIVKHYKQIANGKRGVTFVPDVETAHNVAREFNNNGVPALVVSAKTPDAERIAAVNKLKSGEVWQLVNVDLFGEGFDLPAIEVVSMARPTKSYSLYCQQFGRALRLMISDEWQRDNWFKFTDAQRLQYIAQSVKPRAIIIDHVNNVSEYAGGHGLPDKPRVWTLDNRERRARVVVDGDDIPVRNCPECTAVYEVIHHACPYCGHIPEPVARSGPEYVDGDLLELDAATLAAMRGEVERMDRDPSEVRLELQNKFAPEIGIRAGVNRHAKNQTAQEALRASIAWWGGYQRQQGRDDRESYRRFYHKFGIDVLSAQALKEKDANVLAHKVSYHLGELCQ